ncbi:MAG TPA: response regulator transcription factor [Casimicrobiaceae bacterium]|nr:response regulator transcription factor [Casimicrobiaceae bacterium]
MKILVVDDHPLIQQALAHSLPHLHGPIEVLSAIDRDEAITALARHPDCALVLLDLTLPGAHGMDLLVQMRRAYPHLPIVVLSATHDRGTVGTALAAGAQGYIAKTSTPEELLDAVRTVLAGETSITTDFAAPGPMIGGAPGQALGLTHRQADVLRLLVQGKPNKTICRDLRLSEGTVKVHVSAILRALNVRSRAQAIAELTRRGVILDETLESEHH